MATRNQIKELAQNYLDAGDLESTEILLGMIESGEYEDETTTAGLAFETAKAIPRGFGKGLLSSGAGLAGLANTITDNIGLENLIDEGEDNEIIRLANQGKKAIDETMGVGDQYRDKWLVKAGEGLGSIGSFLVPGGAGALIGRGTAKLATASAGAGFGANDQMERVAATRAKGIDVSKSQEDQAIGWGAVIGTTEAFVPLQILKKLRFSGPPSRKKELIEKIGDASIKGVAEGSQEVLNSVLQDAVQTNLVGYDPNAEVGESLWDDFTIGAASGAALDLITNAFVKKDRSKLTKEAELEREKQFREEEQEQANFFFNQAEIRRTQIEQYNQQKELDAILKERQDLTDAERSRIEQEQQAAMEERYPFDPLMPYKRKISFQGKRLSPSDKKALEAKDYANQIASAATKSAQGFPEKGQFTLQEETTPQGSVFTVTHSETEQQYGQAYLEREDAIHLMSNLNDQILRRNINRNITDSIDETPFDYSAEQTESVYMLGQRLNNPNRDTVTVAMLNEAGGTTGDKFQENLSIDSLHQLQYGVPPYTDKGEKIYKDLSNMTVAQKVNFERVKKGLPEVNEFSLKEAKEALGDKYNNVFDILMGVRAPEVDVGPTSDFGSVGAKLVRSREQYQNDKRTTQELLDIFKNKNITSDINSPEVKYMFDKIVNETNISKMSPSQRAYLSSQLSALPVLPQPAPIPNFKPNPYTLEQYIDAVEVVRSTGDGTIENIQETLEDVGSEKRSRLVAKSIQEKLIDRGLVNEDGSVVETLRLDAPVPKDTTLPDVPLRPYEETDLTTPAEATGIPDIKQFEENIKSDLEKIGLGDVGIRVLSILRNAPMTREGQLVYNRDDPTGVAPTTLGFFKPEVNTIFLGIDTATRQLKAKGQEVTAESLRAEITDTLNHEILHSVRNLDLWTQKEWSSLEKLAREKTVPGRGNETFLSQARKLYPDLEPVSQMEEAVAELVRVGRADPSLITGKPKSLIQKMFSFFERVGNAIRGTGFKTMDQVYESTIAKLESGEIGARERGQIRTLRATERKQRAVPERGIGTETDVLSDEDISPIGFTQQVMESRGGIEPVERGINVRTDGDMNYADLIVSGKKQFESRQTDSLRPYVGKRVGIVETKKGEKAKLVGYATVGEPEVVNQREFNEMRDLHLVPKGSDFDIKRGSRKYMYRMIDPQKLDEPIDVSSTQGRVARNISKITSEVQTREVGKPDTKVRPEVARAYKKLQDNEITREEYDAVVLGTISEYDFIPTPATPPKMINALAGKSQKEKVNAPVEDDMFVGLRLDINAYKNSGTWVPTIHDEKGKSISHQSTARIKNADFTMMRQRKGKDPFDLQEYSKQIMEGKNKFPFAQIMGNFQNKSVQSNVDLAKKALNSPDWIQVGFDPRRHSYFYDRKTGEPVTFAEEVVQVGPLVLAKNATKNVLPSGETFQTLYRRSDELQSEVAAYDKETNYLNETLNRNQPDAEVRIYDEANSKVQDDLVTQNQVKEVPFSFQTSNFKYGKLDAIAYAVADKFIGLKKIENLVNKNRKDGGLPPLETLDSAYAGEQSIAGKAGNELRNFEEKKKRPLADKIARLGLNRNEVDEFLTLRHAIERNNRIALRDPSQDPEFNPGSGQLLTGEKLTNSFVKGRMKEKYNLDWNDQTQTWKGQGNQLSKKLIDIAKDTDAIINETLDRSVKGQLMNKQAAETVRSIYKYYAPLQGKHIEDDIAGNIAQGVSSKSYSTKGKEIKGALGRESAALSPLGNIITNAEKTISRSLNNTEFGAKLVNLIENNLKTNPENLEYWEVYSPTNPRYKKNFSRSYRYIGADSDMPIKNFKSIPKGMNPKDFIETLEFTPDRQTNDLIGVKIDGVQHYVDIKQDDRLRNALIANDSNSSSRLIQILGQVNRFLSMVNTQLNPEFIISNFSRDIQTAILNIVGEQDMPTGKARNQKLIDKVLKDVIPSMGVFYKGIRGYDPKDGTFRGNQTGIDPKDLADVKEFLESGAKADWFYTRPPEEQGKTIDSMIDMANGTFTGNFSKRFKQVMDFVEDTNSAVENAVRLATFKASRDSLLDQGVRREEAVAKAADLAKNLTINFNRKGMHGDLLNSLYLFFNASVQGTMNFGRGLFGPNMNPLSPEASRRKQAMVAGLTLFSGLLADKAEEESEINPETGRSFYSEIPAFVKERNLVIMADPKIKEGRNLSNEYVNAEGKKYYGSQYYYTIPLPYGYNVFSYFGQALSDIARGNISVGQASANLTSALMGSFSPIGMSAYPTAVQPIFEIYTNENFFGSPIYKDPEMFGGTGPKSALSMKSTAAPFKFLAETANALGVPGVIKAGNKYEPGTLDVSPDTLEHLYEFALGGTGQFAKRVFTLGEKVTKGDQIERQDIPFFRRVKGETNARESQADYFERIGAIKNKRKALQNIVGPERLAYRKENVDFIKMMPLMMNTESRLRKLRERRKKLEAIADASPANAKEYGEYVDQIYDIEQTLYNRFNKQYDKVVGRTK